MVDAAMKHMASNFAKFDKFEGVDFRRWQKKMHFLLSSISVMYVTTLIPKDGGDDATVEQIRKSAKWDNDDYVCKGLILNGMFDPLSDIYQNVESSKELWDSLEAKYMVEDASSKKYLAVICALRSPSGCGIVTSQKATMVVVPSWSTWLSKITTPSRHLKKDYKGVNVGNKANGSGTNGLVDGSTNSERIMILRGGLTQEQLCMCVKIDAGSRLLSHRMMDLFLTWEMSQHP
ncbi:hypothetical protein Tco_0210200 [Tanacetum coccineum]